jgi:replicative DNA helicase
VSDGERVPPHNLDAEASVLGGILLNNDAMDEVLLRGAEPDDFYHPLHRAIFEGMFELHQRQQPIDVVTLSAELETHGHRRANLESLPSALADLAARVPTSANVGFYVNIVRERASLRRVIATCGSAIGRAYAVPGDVPGFLDWFEGVAGARRNNRTSSAPIGQLVVGTVKAIEARGATPSGVTGVPTGLPDLDELTVGLQPADLVLLAGRPGTGKTAEALQVARYAALERGIPVLVISLEMSKAQLTERLIVGDSRVDGQHVRTGQLQGAEWGRLTQAMARLSTAPIEIDDLSNEEAPSLLQIRASARRWRRDRKRFPEQPEGEPPPLGLVIVDYLQLIKPEVQTDAGSDQVLGAISVGLKTLAKELSMPVLALSQLNRGIEKREDKRPQQSDLRGSGSLEQDADVILFIYQPAPSEGDHLPEGEFLTEIIVGKQRNGPVGSVSVIFFKPFGRLESLSHREPPQGALPYKDQ